MAKRKHSDEKLVADRRDFLKFASLGAVASGATAIAGTASADEADKNVSGKGYQETQHVQTYYELTKF